MTGKRFSRVETIMDSVAATDGLGGATSTGISVAGFDMVAVQLYGGGSTYAATVTFQGTINGDQWVNLLGMSPTDGSLATAVADDSGIHIFNVAGLSGFRVYLSARTDGNVTAYARRSVGGGGLSVADVEISTEISAVLAELPAVATISDSMVAVDVSKIGALGLGVDDSSKWGPFKTERYDTDGLAPIDSDNAETLAAIAMAYGWDSDGWDRLNKVAFAAGDSLGLLDGLMTGAMMLGLDDSGTVTQAKSIRVDSDGYYPADADNAEHIAVASLQYALGADGSFDRMGLDDAGRLKVMPDWNSTLQGSTTADNEVTFAVPTNKDWHVMWIWLEYTSGATAGTRQVQVDVRDSGDDVIMSLIPGVTQTASLTYRYLFAPGMADLTAARDTDYIMTPMPPSIIIPEFCDIRIHDKADIQTDTQEDSVVIQMMVMDRGRVDT